ncbi:FKBP-type peptidyl-prolyl cis-trans isomerase SlyD [Sinobacterium norvegicum]|uniref:Peptidyl-prolyl cis-trans isomerase n=1 Tax=Sinobacterium norvegicum TaxID=1641715 RepID=A0ABN8EEQ9_9GAMM|nr:peptidylprolyl isomerase [Sinobacterium norvegicum]CAH0990899.1 FKBP-type peptidyl-prolyl cis-trans isomerase SlyD [Sinobacterium norvegicum]
MSKVSANNVVSIHYTLSNEAGDVLDSSNGQEPLNYLHGAQNIIPGLETALENLSVGDSFEVVVQPVDGYGEVNPEMIQQVPVASFEGFDGELVPGTALTATGGDGQTMNVTVVDVNDEFVTVNGNHPLAGMVLCFKGTIDAVRAASAEELDHGHVH